MKKILLICFLFIITSLYAEEIVDLKDGSKAVLYDDHTWAKVEVNNSTPQDILNKNKSHLRNGIQASNNEIQSACEMYDQGWRYTMPRPKSAQAAWGNSDGRTTCYSGWWYNSKTNHYSHTTPKKSSNGLFLGDNQNNSHTWRRGGSPRKPDVYMFLLSQNGGPRY